MFTLAIYCLTTSNLPWFMDLTFQVPMQYCFYSIRFYFSPLDTSTTRHCSCFGSAPSFLLELFLHSSVQFIHSVVSHSLQRDGLQHARLPCPLPTPRACANSCPLSWWCHPTIPSSVVPFSSCLPSFPASRSFPMSQFFALGGQNIRISVSAPVLSMNIQDWFPLGLTGLISLQSKGVSRVFSSTTVQKHWNM